MTKFIVPALKSNNYPHMYFLPSEQEFCLLVLLWHFIHEAGFQVSEELTLLFFLEIPLHVSNI